MTKGIISFILVIFLGNFTIAHPINSTSTLTSKAIYLNKTKTELDYNGASIDEILITIFSFIGVALLVTYCCWEWNDRNICG